MTRDELIRNLGSCFAAIHRNTCYPYAEDFEKEAAGMTLLHALEAAIPGLSGLLDGTHVLVPVDNAMHEHLSIARMCQPIRSYPGTGGLWFGRNDMNPDAEFRDWGAARAFAAIVSAMIAAAQDDTNA